jgi:hypothetical protein
MLRGVGYRKLAFIAPFAPALAVMAVGCLPTYQFGTSDSGSPMDGGLIEGAAVMDAGDAATESGGTVHSGNAMDGSSATDGSDGAHALPVDASSEDGNASMPTWVTDGFNTSQATAPNMISVTSATIAGEKAGGWNVGFLAWFDTTSPQISSVVDTAGNTYTFSPSTPLLGCRADSAIVCQQAFYASNIAVPAGDAGNTVTVTLTAPANALDLRVVEYAGLTAFTDWASNGGGTPPLIAVVNAVPGDRLAVVGAASEGRIMGGTTGVTQRVTTSPFWNSEGDFLVADAGQYSITIDEVPAAGPPPTWILTWLTFQ